MLAIQVDGVWERATYTNVFGKLIMEMIRTSMASEKPIMNILNWTRLLYLCNPISTRFCFTIRIKR